MLETSSFNREILTPPWQLGDRQWLQDSICRSLLWACVVEVNSHRQTQALHALLFRDLSPGDYYSGFLNCGLNSAQHMGPALG